MATAHSRKGLILTKDTLLRRTHGSSLSPDDAALIRRGMNLPPHQVDIATIHVPPRLKALFDTLAKNPFWDLELHYTDGNIVVSVQPGNKKEKEAILGHIKKAGFQDLTFEIKS